MSEPHLINNLKPPRNLILKSPRPSNWKMRTMWVKVSKSFTSPMRHPHNHSKVSLGTSRVITFQPFLKSFFAASVSYVSFLTLCWFFFTHFMLPWGCMCSLFLFWRFAAFAIDLAVLGFAGSVGLLEHLEILLNSHVVERRRSKGLGAETPISWGHQFFLIAQMRMSPRQLISWWECKHQSYNQIPWTLPTSRKACTGLEDWRWKTLRQISWPPCQTQSCDHLPSTALPVYGSST